MDRQSVRDRGGAQRTPAAQAASQRAAALPDHRPAAAAQRKLAEAAQRRANPAQLEGDEVRDNGGMPMNLRAGIESLSGHSMDGVKVHYNSDKPAGLGALAYAQGKDIHLASGQEQHLPHEAWHVVQQAQGRVQPTTAAGGEPVNDDAGLEKEADEMGVRALQAVADPARKAPDEA